MGGLRRGGGWGSRAEGSKGLGGWGECKYVELMGCLSQEWLGSKGLRAAGGGGAEPECKYAEVYGLFKPRMAGEQGVEA